MRALETGGCAYPTRDYVFGLAPIEATARAHILAEKKLHAKGEDSIAAGKVYTICAWKRRYQNKNSRSMLEM